MLKYGKDSVRSRIQPLKEICRDLHCQRDRYTWTSHPALEGTACGEHKWCRSGICLLKTSLFEPLSSIQRQSLKSSDKSSLIDDRKYGNLVKQEYNFNRVSMWSDWGLPSECESGCLFGESGRLREGSTGLKTFRRTCLDFRWSRKKCQGPDRKYEACSSKQCYKVARTTVLEFANQICERALTFDESILRVGVQEVSENPESSCKVFCKSKAGAPVSKSWTFPDGTTCRNQDSDLDDSYYCINGRCEVGLRQERYNSPSTSFSRFRNSHAKTPRRISSNPIRFTAHKISCWKIRAALIRTALFNKRMAVITKASTTK